MSGPGVAATVVVDGSLKAVNLNNVVVMLTNSAGDPGSSMSMVSAVALRGSLASGRSRSGVYVFTVAWNRKSPLSIKVTLNGSAPIAEFKGRVG